MRLRLSARQSYLNTPLIVAAACGHMNVVAWCIEQKVNLNTQEVHGWTALHLAALKVCAVLGGWWFVC